MYDLIRIKDINEKTNISQTVSIVTVMSGCGGTYNIATSSNDPAALWLHFTLNARLITKQKQYHECCSLMLQFNDVRYGGKKYHLYVIMRNFYLFKTLVYGILYFRKNDLFNLLSRCYPFKIETEEPNITPTKHFL